MRLHISSRGLGQWPGNERMGMETRRIGTWQSLRWVVGETGRNQEWYQSSEPEKRSKGHLKVIESEVEAVFCRPSVAC